MSASTSPPSFATNVLNSASGATFDIASGKAAIKVSVSNDKIKQLPVKKVKGVTYYSAKGETFTALSFHALDAAKARKEVPTTKELNALMKYKKDPADKKISWIHFQLFNTPVSTQLKNKHRHNCR
ncbi:MAG: hypothetical protein IPP29_16845 [Bacteroidetes bacterium]|nr:hypothetical protein [Bacteroidota bacterium]